MQENAAVINTTGSQSNDDELFKNFGQNLLKGVIDNLVPIGQQVGGAAAVMNAYDRLGAIGEQGLRASGTIAQEALDNSQFKPFTVKVGSSFVGSPYSSSDVTVGSAVDGGSDLAVNLSEQEGRIKAKLLEQAREGLLVNTPAGATKMGEIGKNALARGSTLLTNIPSDLATREQEIFNRIRATQLPEEERQRLALEERLFGQGRLGVQTSMFGGTPEQLALAKAQEEAQNTATLMAMQQAQQERQNQANLAQQVLGLGQGLYTGQQALEGSQQQRALRDLSAAYLPQAQALNMLQQGLNASQIQQRGQLYGAGLFNQASLQGLATLLGAGVGQAELMGQLGTGLLTNAGGGSSGGGGIGGFLTDLLGEYSDDIASIIFGD